MKAEDKLSKQEKQVLHSIENAIKEVVKEHGVKKLKLGDAMNLVEVKLSNGTKIMYGVMIRDKEGIALRIPDILATLGSFYMPKEVEDKKVNEVLNRMIV